MKLSSYLQSFSAAPFQLYSADWLCLHARVPLGPSKQTMRCYRVLACDLFMGLKLTREEKT